MIVLNSNYSTTKMLQQYSVTDIENELKQSRNSNSSFESVLYLPEHSGRKGEGGLRTKGYLKQNTEAKPLISVITVVFNGEKHLEETIKSVIYQTYENIEYIIIDGGSTDRSIEIIRQYEDKIDYWVTQKDFGIYDAMNKGISLARGELTNLLNSDDYYADDHVITKTIEHFKPGNSILIADTLIINNNKSSVFIFNGNINKLYYQIPFMHPSCFIPLEIYRKKGLYSLSYKVASDVDLLMRLIYNGVTMQKLPFIAVAMRQEGASNSNFVAGRVEYANIFFNYSHNKSLTLYGLIKSVLLFYLSKMKRAIFHG